MFYEVQLLEVLTQNGVEGQKLSVEKKEIICRNKIKFK